MSSQAMTNTRRIATGKIAASRKQKSRHRGPKDRPVMLTLSVLATLLLWNAASLLAGVSPITGDRLVPGTLDVIRSFPNLAYYAPGSPDALLASSGTGSSVGAALKSLLYHTGVSALRLVIGLAAGIAIACLAAVLISWNRTIRRAFMLPAQAFRMLPLLALAPLFGIWFGSGQTGTYAYLAFATFAVMFPVAVSAIDHVPGYYANYARSLGAGSARIYLSVVVPAALPDLRPGVLLSVAFGWSMVLAVEYISQGDGLGFIVSRAQEFSQINTLAVMGCILVIYGRFSYVAAARGFDRLVRWQE